MQDDVVTKQSVHATRWAFVLGFARYLQANPVTVRWILCGPVALIVTLLVMMGMAHWWPRGAARVDNIAMPVVLFPLIWAGIFFYALAEDRLLRASVVMAVLALGNIGLLAIAI